jgi:mono/diheme cytochrome c family protein
VRRHGVAPAADDIKPKQKFYPKQVFKDTIATFVWFAVLVVMAIVAKVPLGRMADPTDTSFVPRPEWYFLFLFQTVKMFEGKLELIGTLVLPTLAILALLMVPFIDRGKAITLRRRTGAIALVVLGAIAWSGLTARAVATTPPSAESDEAGLEQINPWQEIPADQLAAVGYFRKDNCASCHVAGKAAAGPDLTINASSKPVDWLMEHFKKPTPNSPDTQLKNPQLKALAAFVAKRDDKGVDAWANAPQAAVEGAMVYTDSQCAMCHQLNGAGQKTGPTLNGLSDHRKRDWVEGHFAEPAKFSAGSVMPAYKFNPQDLDRITSYLMQIPKQ